MARILLALAAGLGLGLTLALPGCAPLPAPGDAPAAAGRQCAAAPAAWALGHAATPEVVERIRVDSGSRLARVLHPGEAVTLEFSAERVNVQVNARNAIVGISCG